MTRGLSDEAVLGGGWTQRLVPGPVRSAASLAAVPFVAGPALDHQLGRALAARAVHPRRFQLARFSETWVISGSAAVGLGRKTVAAEKNLGLPNKEMADADSNPTPTMLSDPATEKRAAFARLGPGARLSFDEQMLVAVRLPVDESLPLRLFLVPKSLPLSQLYQKVWSELHQPESQAQAVFLTVDQEGRKAAGKHSDPVGDCLLDGQVLFFTYGLGPREPGAPPRWWLSVARPIVASAAQKDLRCHWCQERRRDPGTPAERFQHGGAMSPLLRLLGVGQLHPVKV